MSESPRHHYQPNKSSRLTRLIWKKILRLLQLNEDTDVAATISSITKSVEFKGVNIWILAFAIVVASVGLNVNSTAVIIGAMLISPLMGPINGVGLALGISDTLLLRKAMKNLLIMVIISLIFSTAYFVVSPLSDAQSELLARTTPTIYDVMIALFGGLAGIVALSRKEQPLMVIAGVAIATALMPPLCTAGFGLATLQLNYFIGAFYLFFINSVCIAIATYVMVKYLKFPQKKYLDPKRKRLQKQTITFFLLIIIVPSLFMAINMIQENSFNKQIGRFVTDIQKWDVFQERQLLNTAREYSRKKQNLTLTVVGTPLSVTQIDDLQKCIKEDYGLTNTQLIVKQTNITGGSSAPSELLSILLDKQNDLIRQKDSIIAMLDTEIRETNKISSELNQIAKEIAIQYPEIANFSIANPDYINPKTLAYRRIPTAYISWRNVPKKEEHKQFILWLKIRLQTEELKVIDEQFDKKTQ